MKYFLDFYRKKGAILLWEEEKPLDAVPYFESSIEYKPTADGYYGLGAAYAMEAKAQRDISLLEKGEEALEKAVELEPGHPSATRSLRHIRKTIAELAEE